MKKILNIAACVVALTLMVSGLAIAGDGGFYGSIKAGGSWLNGDSSFDRNTTEAITEDDFTTDGTGFVGGAIGYNWMDMDLPIRTELEYAYNGDFKYEYADGNATVDNDITIQTLMVNVYWDFYNDTAFTPYINGGVGAAFIEEDYDGEGVSAGDTLSDDSSTTTNFAFNVGAGVGWSLTDSVILDLAYRYEYFGNGDEVTLTGSTGIGNYTFETENLATHKAILGLRYQF